MAKAAEVASQITIPSRSAAIQSAFGARTPEVVPFQGKTRSFVGIDLRHVRELTPGRLQDLRLISFR